MALFLAENFEFADFRKQKIRGLSVSTETVRLATSRPDLPQDFLTP